MRHPSRPSSRIVEATYRGESCGLEAELHELKRRNEAPIALIEMLDALLSLDPNLNAKQKRKRSYVIMARALQRLERKDA